MAAPRALIVDDDLEVLQVLAEFVKREGFVASVASTIGQAREEIAANPPDILLVDILLPDGSGLDLLDGLDTAADPEVVLTDEQLDEAFSLARALRNTGRIFDSLEAIQL